MAFFEFSLISFEMKVFLQPKSLISIEIKVFSEKGIEHILFSSEIKLFSWSFDCQDG